MFVNSLVIPPQSQHSYKLPSHFFTCPLGVVGLNNCGALSFCIGRKRNMVQSYLHVFQGSSNPGTGQIYLITQSVSHKYHRLLKICPWAMNLSGCSKRGVGVFSQTLSPKNRPTPFKCRPILFESRPTQVLKNHYRFVMQ